MLSQTGEIRRDESCIDYAGQSVMVYPCHGMLGNQEWIYGPVSDSLFGQCADESNFCVMTKQQLSSASSCTLAACSSFFSTTSKFCQSTPFAKCSLA